MKIRLKKIKKYSLPFILSLSLITLLIVTYQVILADKYYPQTYIGDTNISFLTKSQAQSILENKFNQRLSQSLQFSSQDGNFTINLSPEIVEVDHQKSLQQAQDAGHSGSTLKMLQDQISLIINPQVLSPEIKLSLEDQIDNIAQKIDSPPQDATLWLDKVNSVHLTHSTDGLILDKGELQKQIKNYLSFGTTPISLPVKVVEPSFPEKQATSAKHALEAVKDEPIKLTFEGTEWLINVPTLYHLLNLTDNSSLLDPKKLESYLKDISSSIDKDVQEGLFNFNPQTKRVTEFRPSQQGQKLDSEKTSQLILLAIDGKRAKNITLPVDITKPKISLGDVNDLGINELIGQGVSRFAGSIPNRIYNVNLTAQKINGVLIPPGQVFSFNQTVGDISAATGFKQAYVIKEGRTVLDDGGGVCQDSTTLFRAVLNAGLPIISRTAHAYRVGYYEQGFPPGLDATVFYPSVDFKFKNDTKSHILVQAYTSGLTLYIDLYGTSDGRKVTLTTPVIASQTPPPPELRQDDPTLPKGTIKQVDWAAWGAQVSFNRTVTRNSETLIKETWKSNYKPWQAVYLVGTQ